VQTTSFSLRFYPIERDGRPRGFAPGLQSKKRSCKQLGVTFEIEEETAVVTDGEWRHARLSPELHAELTEALKQSSITHLRNAFEKLYTEAPALAAHLQLLMQHYDMVGIKAAPAY
jgi:hypothetical protein